MLNRSINVEMFRD